jgi:hypothetical protein
MGTPTLLVPTQVLFQNAWHSHFPTTNNACTWAKQWYMSGTMETPSEPKYLTLWDSNFIQKYSNSHFPMHTAVNPMQTNNKYNCYACTWAKQRYRNGNHWYSLRTKILDLIGLKFCCPKYLTLSFSNEHFSYLIYPFVFPIHLCLYFSLSLSFFCAHHLFNSRVQT